MFIHQAIYTSVNAAFNRGYHLVAKSSGVAESIAQGLCRWSPSHGCLNADTIETESLSFFQPHPDWFAISRSLYGAPEFSQRGGMQIVTIHLVFHADQLARFENNPIACARIALSTGLLTLPLEMPRLLPPIDFPEPRRQRESQSCARDEIQNLLCAGKPVALVGEIDPLARLDGLLQSTSFQERGQLSFTTGLKPSAQRPFRIQFFPSADKKLRNELIRGGFCVRDCLL
jgi:hypothetical protein